MKAIKLAQSALVVVMAVAAANAWTQQPADPAGPADQGASTAAPPAHPESSAKKAARKANRALGRKVRTALSKGGIDVSAVNVVARHGAVTLAGTVPDPSQIDKAGELAKGVQGVTSVKNAISVRYPGGGG
jgi:osmotically-inducible protein OsmY